MHPKLFSVIVSTVAIVAMFLVTISIFFGASSSLNNEGYLEKSVALPTGVTLNYVEHGNAYGTPVIFLHGFTDSWHSFEHVLNRFPNNLHVIAISQRGHGNSTKTQKTNDPKYFASDVAAFIREKKLGSCVIVGHSLGGLITQQFTLDYPELTRAIVIVSSEASFYDNEGMPEFVEAIKNLNDPVDRKFAEDFQWSTIAKPLDSVVVNKFIDESMKVPAPVWRAVGDLLTTTNYSQELKNIETPTLILWGDKDAICNRNGQRQLVEGIHNSRLLVYENTGHAPHWEDGDRFVRDVTAFVATLP